MSGFFLKIAGMSISASCLVLAVLLLRLVLKKAPKWISVLLWGLVALRLLMPFSIESNFSLVPEPLAYGQIVANIGEVSIGKTDTVEIYEGHEPQAGQQPVGSFIVQEGSLKPAKTVKNTVYPILSWIWISGVALMLLYTVASYLLLQRRVNTAVQLKKGIFQSENVDSPFVLGIIKPKIYLPFRMEDQALEYVIAHEQSHIRRKDHWWKPFGFILLAVHWFNPLMWVGYILLCRDIELACDEKVIKQMDSENRANYTEALVICSVHRRRIAACPLAFGEVGIKERVKSVMNYKKPAFWIIIASVVISIIVAICFLTDPNTTTDDSLSVSIDGQIAAHFQSLPDPDKTEQSITNNGDHDPGIISLNDVVIIDNKTGDILWNAAPGELIPFEFIITNDQGEILNTEDQTITLEDWFTIHNAQGEILDTDGGKHSFSAEHMIIVDNKTGKVVYDGSDGLEIVRLISTGYKTYYELQDGTWFADGHHYQHRLEIPGRMPNAVADSTFVYLSNLETISFERAWKAAGLSSLSTDYFSPEEALLVDWRTGDQGSNAVDGNNNLILKTDKLHGAIAEAILSQHRSEKPDGLLNTESHIILVNQVTSGTPLAGQTGHVQEVTVYVYYLNMRFNVQGDRPEEHEGIYGSAAITFTVDADGIYTLKHFIKPESSVDHGAAYDDQLVAKFVAASEDIAANEEQYSKQLLDSCWKNATEYMEHIKAQASAQPGGAALDKVDTSEYLSYEWARQLYQSLEASMDSMTEEERFSALAEIFDTIAQGHPSEQAKFAKLFREISNSANLVFEDEEVFDLAREYATVFSRLTKGDRDFGIQGLTVNDLSETAALLNFPYWGEMWYSVRMVQIGDPWVTGEFTGPYRGELGQYLMMVQFHDADPSAKFLAHYSMGTNHPLRISYGGVIHEMTMRIMDNADHGYNVYIGSNEPFSVTEQSSVTLNRLIGTVSVPLDFQPPVSNTRLTGTGQGLAQPRVSVRLNPNRNCAAMPAAAKMK